MPRNPAVRATLFVVAWLLAAAVSARGSTPGLWSPTFAPMARGATTEREGLMNEECSVRRAAARGARSVSRRRQVIDDAVQLTLEKWQLSLLRGRRPRHAESWAFRVGANAAMRIGAKKLIESVDPREFLHPLVTMVRGGAVESLHHVGREVARSLLCAQLVVRQKWLRGRQFAVVQKLCEPGMSLHKAAKELGMDRSNLRRSFVRALRRLRGWRPDPPPLQVDSAVDCSRTAAATDQGDQRMKSSKSWLWWGIGLVLAGASSVVGGGEPRARLIDTERQTSLLVGQELEIHGFHECAPMDLDGCNACTWNVVRNEWNTCSAPVAVGGCRFQPWVECWFWNQVDCGWVTFCETDWTCTYCTPHVGAECGFPGCLL